jgi:hypothetical protein
MEDTRFSETRDGERTGAQQEVMCGARGDRFGVNDIPLREGLPWAMAMPTLHGYTTVLIKKTKFCFGGATACHGVSIPSTKWSLI